MRSRTRTTTRTLAALVLACAAAGASGQQVWRCGNTYSQQPCPGGTPVQADDARTGEQARQAASAARRQAQAADALEKSRLAQEAKAQRAQAAKAPASTARREPEEKDRTYSEVKAKKAPYFTAVSPRPAAEDKKKPAKKEGATKPDAKGARSG